ncbi:MAG: hypothetical protein KJ072_20615 [Verrucomicrobia bacterium]|nr:hypothetical protein [Verrucomicrobiota bacterium]
MSGEASHLTPLESRKQRLIAESELNRAELSEEWRTMTHEAGGLARRVKTVGRWSSAAVLLVVGVLGLRRGPRAVGVKSGWFPGILNGVRLASVIWLAFRERNGT